MRENSALAETETLMGVCKTSPLLGGVGWGVSGEEVVVVGRGGGGGGGGAGGGAAGGPGGGGGGGGGRRKADGLSFWQAMKDAGQLRYLDGGGAGCMNDDDRPTDRRRLYHHL